MIVDGRLLNTGTVLNLLFLRFGAVPGQKREFGSILWAPGVCRRVSAGQRVHRAAGRAGGFTGTRSTGNTECSRGKAGTAVTWAGNELGSDATKSNENKPREK